MVPLVGDIALLSVRGRRLRSWIRHIGIARIALVRRVASCARSAVRIVLSRHRWLLLRRIHDPVARNTRSGVGAVVRVVSAHGLLGGICICRILGIRPSRRVALVVVQIDVNLGQRGLVECGRGPSAVFNPLLLLLPDVL